eukprot:m.911012 g.911012  ORF g.911012 m.911012 type:complete len:170 (-) comp23724_c0_seq30:386-895(-)
MPPLHKGTCRRLLKELVDNRKAADSKDHVYLQPLSESDLSLWQATLVPQSPSLYEGGKFHLSISLSSSYPIEPPMIRFVTPVCHPNVHATTGEICVDVLRTEWSPAWTLHAACLAVLVLLDNPDPSSPLNCDAANLLRSNDSRGYSSLVRTYTRMHAMGDAEVKALQPT